MTTFLPLHCITQTFKSSRLQKLTIGAAQGCCNSVFSYRTCENEKKLSLQNYQYYKKY